MGEHFENARLDAADLRMFMKQLLRDVQALEYMLAHGIFESGVRRIGAEQELFLVDRAWRPAPIAAEVLEAVNDPHLTPELGKFNLEFNLDPLTFEGNCLSRMEQQICELLDITRPAARAAGGELVMTGILPTLDLSDLGLSFMTEHERYFTLNKSLTDLRGGSAYEFRIRGTDELLISHTSVMLEACNTSFQCHFQVGVDEFASVYNIAQAVAAPVLASCTNSPLLFGKRLWRESRIPLFQQSLDTRGVKSHQRQVRPRVSFGDRWIDESVLEIFQEDIARYRVLMATGDYEDPFEVLEAGGVPQLHALRLHNGTVYRWNRACYGISEGRPHLRIENRILPAGPTPQDEIANAAFWFGVMHGMAARHEDIREVLDFDAVQHNFVAAARLGLGAQFSWMNGKTVPAQKLICELLLPVAREGLDAAGIDASDSDRYLGLIDQRVSTGRTPSQWLLSSLAAMKNRGTKAERFSALTAAMVARQQEGKPGHEWAQAELHEAGGWKPNFARVEQYMTTDLFTVNENELVDLVANLMDWKHIRYVPVEDAQHRLVGIVTYRSLLRFMVKRMANLSPQTVPVSEVMLRDPLSVLPTTTTSEAIVLMRDRRIGCLPVVEDGRLVGIITENDFMVIAGQLLEQQLSE